MLMIRVVRPVVTLMLAVSFFVSGVAAQSKAKADKKPEPSIKLTTKPMPPTAGQTTFTVTAQDASGKPITGADVTVELVMPPMGAMAEMKNTITLKPASDPKVAAEGTYVGTGPIMMAGKWTATVEVKVAGKSVAQQKLPVTAK